MTKPYKYDIKFWVLVDVETGYVVHIFPYLGKDDDRQTNQRLADHVVIKLVEPYLGKGRNITCDNFFTSMTHLRELKKKRTSIVGTMNRARREVPLAVKTSREPLYTTHVLKTEGDSTLTVYQGKDRKNVLLLSSMHPDVEVGSDLKRKPETVAFYNMTKYGVDVVDQMCRKYSAKAASRRWPVQVFYNMLNLAGINAWILYKTVTGIKITRRHFIFKLAEELSAPYIHATSAPRNTCSFFGTRWSFDKQTQALPSPGEM